MSPARMARLEKAIRVVLKFTEAFNRQDADVMSQYIGQDCVMERPDPSPDGTTYSGKDAISQYWQDFFKESPNAHVEIEEIFSYGYRCILRWRYEWGDEAGKPGHLRGVDVYKIEGDLISEIYSYAKG